MAAVVDTASISPMPGAVHRDSGATLMQVRNLRKAFGGQVVLDGVDLELREGEIVLLRGENGSGKTTLLNILTGNMEPDAGEISLYANSLPEHFRFPRHWWQELNPWDHFTPERVASEGVGRTWQDVRLFGSQTLTDNLAVARPGQPGENPWRVLARPGSWMRAEEENRRAVLELLNAFGLAGRGDSSADKISLGQTKRIAFARSAHAAAKIVFLDEPLSGLDHKGVEEVVALLRTLAAEHRLTLVIVEHVFNIPFILDFATAVWTLKDGHIACDTIAETKAGEESRIGAALPELIRGIAGAEISTTEERLPRGAVLTRVPRQGIPFESLLTVKGLVARRGHRLVIGEEKDGSVTGLNITVHKGELVFLQAPNGWGKTSLLDCLTGVLPTQAGRLELDARALEHMPPWERRNHGLAVLRSQESVFGNITVGEYRRLCSAERTSLLFKQAPFDESRQLSSLSGGERKRLALEGACSQEAKLLVLDEPFSSLDATAATDILRQLLLLEASCLVLEPTQQNHAGE